MSNALDAITDKVLAYHHPLKVIAGTPDAPLRIGDIEIPCYVLEDEMRVLSQRGFLSGIGRSGNRPARPANGRRALSRFLGRKEPIPLY